MFMWIGAIIGFTFGRWTGLVLGLLAGYWISRGVRSRLMQGLQGRFLESTFAVMGAVCKADGRISEQEIQVAETLFQKLHLNAEARESARAAFRRGKLPGFDLDQEVADFARAAHGAKPLLNMFLQFQLAAVAADGKVTAEEHSILLRIARGLGLSEAEVQQLEASLRMQGQSAEQKLDDAYQVMGLTPEASDAELKKAYRKLMSENHPDKLAARGMPESMRAMAEEKTRDITTAYDAIKQSRGIS